MDSFNDVLDAAKAYCREHTADATYQYYISGLKAVSFENSNCITLEVRNDFICKIVSDRYTGLLKDAFKAVLGFDVEVKFTVPQPEPEAAKENAQWMKPACPRAGMISPLKTSSAARPTNLPLRRRRRLRQTRPVLTIRCSFTDRPVWAKRIC